MDAQDFALVTRWSITPGFSIVVVHSFVCRAAAAGGTVAVLLVEPAERRVGNHQRHFHLYGLITLGEGSMRK